MPTDPRYQYDVFLSYQREDHSWARQLCDELQKAGLSVFLDYQRLEQGREWEPQLLVAMNNSEHLVVLWSDKARDSSWVRREIAHFEARIDAPALGQEAESTLMIFVLLEGEPIAYPKIRVITDLRDAGVYDSGIESASANLWTAVAGWVETAIGDLGQAPRQVAGQVFISHNTERDGGFAQRLARDLEALGVRVWIAPESINPGETWATAIQRGLEESTHALIVCTPAGMDSRWVDLETSSAIALERQGRLTVIPLDVRACRVPLFLQNYQMLSFRQDYATALQQLASRLKPRDVTRPQDPTIMLKV